MVHTLSRDGLSLAVSTLGAELQSLRGLGREWLWQGDPAVWGRRAPACFPWCGRLKDGWFARDGVRYEGGPHGFARELEHTLLGREAGTLAFRLDWSADTLARYPWKFRLDTVYALEGASLSASYHVTNLDEGPMPFQAGFHYAFSLPLAPGLSTEDHRLRFQGPERPVEVLTLAGGLVSGRRPRFTGRQDIPLDDHLFDQDSICLSELSSPWIQLEGTGAPALRVWTEGFPYVLLWSKPGPMRFVCIEPWHGLPDDQDGDHDLFHRPGIRVLSPGETFTCTQRVELLPAL